jgi:hypothetical protein
VLLDIFIINLNFDAMENLKVKESVEAFNEMDTVEGQKMVMEIVLPQLNDEERKEFFKKCSDKFDEKLKLKQIQY